jgi:small-conductance mechanosensitive channel
MPPPFEDLLPRLERRLEASRARVARQQRLVDALEQQNQPVADLAQQALQALRRSRENLETLVAYLRAHH